MYEISCERCGRRTENCECEPGFPTLGFELIEIYGKTQNHQSFQESDQNVPLRDTFERLRIVEGDDDWQIPCDLSFTPDEDRCTNLAVFRVRAQRRGAVFVLHFCVDCAKDYLDWIEEKVREDLSRKQ